MSAPQSRKGGEVLGVAEVLLVGTCVLIALLVVVTSICMLLFVWVSKSSVNSPELISQVAALAKCFGRLMLDLAISVSVICGRAHKIDYAATNPPRTIGGSSEPERSEETKRE